MNTITWLHMSGSGKHGKTVGLRYCLHLVLEHPIYSITMGAIILANSVVVIHETDQKAAGLELPQLMSIASSVFLAIYTLELLVRFYVLRLAFFGNSWNILDLGVVLADLLAEILKLFADNEVPSASVLRIFRLARLVRLVAMLTIFQELQTMLLGFGSAIKGVIWASVMIGVVVTVCSIVAVEFIHPLNVEVAEKGAYGDCTRCGHAFETVLESNLTFIQQIIAGDSWGRITIPIIEAYPAAGMFFLLVFGFIDLGVLNLILTVIVNAAEAARQSNQEMQLRIKAHEAEKLKTQLKTLVAELDTDDDGNISMEEFMSGVDANEELRKTLALLDFQRQDAEIIYFLMDEDQSGDVDYNEFINAMITWKQESLNTKMLFLKASIHDIYRDLKKDSDFLSEGIAARILTPEKVTQAVHAALAESSAKSNLHPGDIRTEFESLTQKLDQRWEQLQFEQAKKYEMLDQVFEVCLPHQRPWSSDSASQIPQEEPSVTARGLPGLLSLPNACTNCQVADSGKSRIPAQSNAFGRRADFAVRREESVRLLEQSAAREELRWR